VIRKIQEEAEGAIKRIQRAKITKKQAVYIINSVVLTRIVYRVQNTILPKAIEEKLMRQYTTVVKNKAGIAITVPNSTIHHYQIYGLKTIKEKQALQHMSMMHRQLNYAEFRNSTLLIRLQQIQNSANTNQSILDHKTM